MQSDEYLIHLSILETAVHVIVACTPIKVMQLFCWPMTPLIIGLPYDHPHPSGSWQLAYKNFGC